MRRKKSQLSAQRAPEHLRKEAWPATGPVPTLILCEFNSENDLMIMEVGEGRNVQDSEPATISLLVKELESAGVVDCTINGHTLERTQGLEGHVCVCLMS